MSLRQEFNPDHMQSRALIQYVVHALLPTPLYQRPKATLILLNCVFGFLLAEGRFMN